MVSMILPMVCLMRYHRYDWRYRIGMTIAMLAPVALFKMLMWIGLISMTTLRTAGSITMNLGMVIYMLFTEKNARPCRQEIMMTNTFLNMPYAHAHEEGKRIYSFGELLTVVKASSEQTGGAFNLFDVTYSQGYATPLHTHYAEDVALFVLEGALTSFWDNDQCEARVGSFLFQPKGTPHGFRVVGDSPARILYMTIPAGFDRFIHEHQLTSQKTEIEEEAARYKIEILGSLPQCKGDNS